MLGSYNICFAWCNTGELSVKADPETSFELLFSLIDDNKKAEVRSA